MGKRVEQKLMFTAHNWIVCGFPRKEQRLQAKSAFSSIKNDSVLFISHYYHVFQKILVYILQDTLVLFRILYTPFRASTQLCLK